MKTFEQNGQLYSVEVLPDAARDIHLHKSGRLLVFNTDEIDDDGELAVERFRYLSIDYTYEIVGLVRDLTEAQCAELIYVGQIYDTETTSSITYKNAFVCLLQSLGFAPETNLLILKLTAK